MVWIWAMGLALAQGPPDWYQAHIAFLTQGSGRWVADNSAYRTEDEPADAYVVEWVPALNGAGLTGRLYGRTSEGQSPDFWHFREFWHPVERRVVAEQWGLGGQYGVGTAIRVGSAQTLTDQTMYAPDGTESRLGHTSHATSSDAHVVASFDIVDGEWRPRRSYTWTLEVEGAKGRRGRSRPR